MAEQLLSAVLAIILGVGALVLYFYGTNWLLDFLIPNRLEDFKEKQGLTVGSLSLSDALIAVASLLLLVAFLTLPWIRLESEAGVISRTGYEMLTYEPVIDDEAELSAAEQAEQAEATEDEVLALEDQAALQTIMDRITDRASFINWVLMITIVVGVVLGIWGMLDVPHRPVSALLGVYVGVMALIYFVLLSMQLTASKVQFFESVGVGVWVALGAALLYFVQAILPRPTLPSYTKAIDLRESIRPWLFVAPALILLFLYLIYPAIQTTILAFYDRNGNDFVGLANFQWAANADVFREAVRNTFLWLFVPVISTALGLLIAVLADNVRWGSIAKSLIFMPMAISFVGASVIWKFMYDYRAEGSDQIGFLNAVVTAFGGEPQAWIAMPFWNNFFLMFILIWIQTGFAMVLLAAALRGVPEETLEAARIDGANEVEIFFNIMIPQIMSTIIVVMTTITITVLKVFDIVAAMTNGQFNTQVLANLMYDQAFRAFHEGRGSVVALFIMIAVIPIMVWNIRKFREEEVMR